MAASVHDPRYRLVLDVLRATRIANGWSQQELANRLGTRQQFVSKYEAGERKLDIVETLDIAAKLGLEPIDLLRAAAVKA